MLLNVCVFNPTPDHPASMCEAIAHPFLFIVISTLPSVAGKVSETLRGVNPSVFFFGWASGYTTITSNKTVAKDIEKIIQENK